MTYATVAAAKGSLLASSVESSRPASPCPKPFRDRRIMALPNTGCIPRRIGPGSVLTAPIGDRPPRPDGHRRGRRGRTSRAHPHRAKRLHQTRGDRHSRPFLRRGRRNRSRRTAGRQSIDSQGESFVCVSWRVGGVRVFDVLHKTDGAARGIEYDCEAASEFGRGVRGDQDLAAEPGDLGQRLVEVGDTDYAKPAGFDVITKDSP